MSEPRTLPNANNWGQMNPPRESDILEIAQDAYAALPASMRGIAGDVMIAVHDLPEQHTVAALGLKSPFELLCIYEPGKRAGEGTLRLYRRSILDYWIEKGDSLAYIISHLLAEEINRHFSG